MVELLLVFRVFSFHKNQAVSQDFFVECFDKLDYFAQVALLKKHNRKSLSKELSSTLTQNLDHRTGYFMIITTTPLAPWAP